MLLLSIAVVLIVVGCFVSLRPLPSTAKIVDADTLMVHGRKWRLNGFDAPEWDQPGGPEASRELRRILSGRGVYMTFRGEIDPYNRPLVTIFTMRGPLAWRMALAGHAHGEGRIGRELTRVARFARRGLWSHPGTVVSPSTWREMHPRT